MAWKDFAIARRQRAVATALVYGLSLTVRFTSSTGEEASAHTSIAFARPATASSSRPTHRSLQRGPLGPSDTQPCGLLHDGPGVSPCCQSLSACSSCARWRRSGRLLS